MKPKDKAEVFETALTKCWFDEDGIVCSVSKVAERTIENYDELFELYRKISKDGAEKICLLGDISETQPLDKNVREYISGELPKYVKAMAFISKTKIGRVVGNTFKVLQEAPYPIRMFDNLEDARQWLKQYL